MRLTRPQLLWLLSHTAASSDPAKDTHHDIASIMLARRRHDKQ